MYKHLGLTQPHTYATYPLVEKRKLGYEEETYTLSVNDPGHRFDSEGVIAKNTAADITKMSMIKTFEDDWLYEIGYRMLIQVHDEIVGEVPQEWADHPKFTKRLRYHMEHALPYDLVVALATSGKTAPNWGGCK